MKREAKTLIVDDSKIALLITSSILNKYDIVDITEAENGLQALEHFQRALLDGMPYSLVFLDIVMPVLDGHETLRQMRAMEISAGVAVEDKAIIIIATVLHSIADMIHAMIEGDCTDYLVKPFDAEDAGGMLSKYNFYL